VDRTVYTSYGYTERKAAKHSTAEVADCEDAGQDAAGSVFPKSPRRVTTWAFSEYPPAKVVGVRSDKGSFAVFVADSVPAREGERIYEELASGGD
jgi:translation initiation factor 2B subunit (eIF-2B alpha/beta/delta family)